MWNGLQANPKVHRLDHVKSYPFPPVEQRPSFGLTFAWQAERVVAPAVSDKQMTR